MKSNQPVCLLLKAHVETYTRNDGTVVQAHDDKRPSAKIESDGVKVDDHALLARIATARSAKAPDEAAFRKAGYIKSSSDGWVSITQKGKDFLQSKGYTFDSKKGWVMG